MINMSKTITLCLLATLAMAAYCDADQPRNPQPRSRFGVRRGYRESSDAAAYASLEPNGSSQSLSTARTSTAGYEQPTYSYQQQYTSRPAPSRAPPVRRRPTARYAAAPPQPRYYPAPAIVPRQSQSRTYAYANPEPAVYHQDYDAVHSYANYDQEELDDFEEQQEELRRQQEEEEEEEELRRLEEQRQQELKLKRRQKQRQQPAPQPGRKSASAKAEAKANGRKTSASAEAEVSGKTGSSKKSAAARRAAAEAEAAAKAKEAEEAAAKAESLARSTVDSYMEDDDDDDDDERDYDSDASDESGLVTRSSYKSRVSGHEDYEEDNEDGDAFYHADEYGKDDDEDAFMDYRDKNFDLYKNGDELRKKGKDTSFTTKYSKKSREKMGSQTASDRFSNSRKRSNKMTKKDVDQSSTKFADGKLETETAQTRGKVKEVDEEKKGTPRVDRTPLLSRPLFVPPTFQKPTA